jgi:hypothetical protein
MSPFLAVLRSYWLDWPSGLFLVAMYVLLLCASIFGDAGPEFILLGSYMAVVLVSTRLRSTRGYSLAYVLPGYRTAHLQVAAALIALLAWFPAIVVGLYQGNLQDVVALVLVVTGIVLTGEYRYRKLYSMLMAFVFSMILLVLVMADVKLQWAPGVVTNLLLGAIGLALLVHFVRIFLAGDEYVPHQMGSMWFGTAGSAWVLDRSTLSRQTELASFRPGGMGVLTRTVRLIERYRQSGRGPRYLDALIDLGVGDWLRWQGVRMMTVTFGIGICILIWWVAPAERLSDVLPRVVVALTFTLQVIVSITYMADPKWSLTFIWTRLPVADKAALRQTYWMTRFRHVAFNYLLACGYCALVVAAALLVQNWLDLEGQKVTPAGSAAVPLIPYLATLMTWALAVTAGGVGVGLILSRWKLGLTVALLMGLAILVLWVGLAMWLTAPFNERIVAFSLTLLLTAFACLVPVAIWRYRAFYDHLNHGLFS